MIESCDLSRLFSLALRRPLLSLRCQLEVVQLQHHDGRPGEEWQNKLLQYCQCDAGTAAAASGEE